MAKIKIQGHASGTGILTVTAPNTSTDRTITLPDATGTLLNSDGSAANLTSIPAANITGTLPAISGANLTNLTQTYTPATHMVATGGTITTIGDYKIHTFTSSGTFTVTTLGTFGNVEYLIVAGGGAGGSHGGSGGGAGGVLSDKNSSVTAQAYTVTVGAGGANATGGSNSLFNSKTAIGGGRGSTYNSHGADSGGSGGGGNFILSASNGVPGSGTNGQGNRGGYVHWPNSGNHATAGGGGAGTMGTDPDSVAGPCGHGGDGIMNDINGTAYFWGGGGGGGAHGGYAGHGGIGGGGGGANNSSNSQSNHWVGFGGGNALNSGGTAGSGASQRGGAGGANTGGAGGGGAPSGTSYCGLGGSGIVIIKYRFQD